MQPEVILVISTVAWKVQDRLLPRGLARLEHESTEDFFFFFPWQYWHKITYLSTNFDFIKSNATKCESNGINI